jgi:hypothetical protein
MDPTFLSTHNYWIMSAAITNCFIVGEWWRIQKIIFDDIAKNKDLDISHWSIILSNWHCMLTKLVFGISKGHIFYVYLT